MACEHGEVPEPSRFFDGETMDPTRPPVILLERIHGPGPERFRMRRRIAYQDRHYDEAHVVPADPERFASDLTSVPHLFTWLIPRTGAHLPAALLHDGLVAGDLAPATYLGPKVNREEADRIFRDAMGDLGTSLVRRWLMWTAVIIATIWHGAIASARYFQIVVTASLGAIVVLGVLSTLDLFDLWISVPWMADRPWYAELIGGALMAVLVPVLLAVLWGRFWRAGLIAGLALAFLLHVTAVLATLSFGFWLVERVVERLAGSTRPASPSP